MHGGHTECMQGSRALRWQCTRAQQTAARPGHISGPAPTVVAVEVVGAAGRGRAHVDEHRVGALAHRRAWWAQLAPHILDSRKSRRATTQPWGAAPDGSRPSTASIGIKSAARDAGSVRQIFCYDAQSCMHACRMHGKLVGGAGGAVRFLSELPTKREHGGLRACGESPKRTLCPPPRKCSPSRSRASTISQYRLPAGSGGGSAATMDAALAAHMKHCSCQYP